MLRKVLAIFPRDERWKMAALFAAMLLTGVIQTLGIASVMPFIALVANPNALGDYALLRSAYAFFGFETQRQFLFFTGIVVVIVFAAGNVIAAFTSWLGLRFVWHNHHRISERLLERYLWKPYSFFLGRHGARLTKTLMSEVMTVVDGVVVPCLEVASKGVAALLVIALLIAMDPVLAVLVSASLGGAYVVIYQLVRRRQKRLGERQIATRMARYRVASEAFGGIKDVKVLGREAAFLARFSGPSKRPSFSTSPNACAAWISSPFSLP